MDDAIRLDAPPPELRFRRRLRVRKSFRELWRSREIVFSLAERDIRVRYKQTFLGFAWAVVTPIVLMVVFTFVFKRIGKIDTGGAPYPVFVYLGLIPWGFFSTSVSQGGQSLVTNPNLLNKVFCPREVFPIGALLTAAFDSAISVFVLGILFILTRYAPKSETLFWVPLLVLIQVMFTTGVTLIASAIVVYLRDLRQALPLLLQIGLFATPIAYPITLVPASMRTVYAALNPLAPVIDGYRGTVLYGHPPVWNLLIPAMITAPIVMFVGYVLFKRLETGFADVA